MKIASTPISESLNSLNKAKEEEEKAIKKIASPRPLDSTNGASLAIADELLSQISSMSQGVRNANDAIGILQIADSTLANVSQSAIRINELSVSLGNPALNSQQQAMIANEASSLTQSINDSVSQATFNGKNIFSGSLSFVTGSGTADINLQAPNTDNLNVYNQQSITDFLDIVSKTRADIGATIGGIQAGINSNLQTLVNLKSAESGLQDNDLAENYNQLNLAKLKKNAALYTSSFNTRHLQERLHELLG